MIKAIPTNYRGITFRSRLEAHWAVFFDVLGIKYHYELEGFDLGHTCYLPDFFLPGKNVWLEIKPKPPTNEEWNKAASLLLALVKSGSNAGVGILYGRPWLDDTGPEYCYLSFSPQIGRHCLDEEEKEYNDITKDNITIDYIDDDECIFVQCRRCGEISLDGLGIHFPQKARDGYSGLHGCCDRESATLPQTELLLKAYKEATDKKFSSNKDGAQYLL